MEHLNVCVYASVLQGGKIQRGDSIRRHVWEPVGQALTKVRSRKRFLVCVL